MFYIAKNRIGQICIWKNCKEQFFYRTEEKNCRTNCPFNIEQSIIFWHIFKNAPICQKWRILFYFLTYFLKFIFLSKKIEGQLESCQKWWILISNQFGRICNLWKCLVHYWTKCIFQKCFFLQTVFFKLYFPRSFQSIFSNLYLWKCLVQYCWVLVHLAEDKELP